MKKYLMLFVLLFSFMFLSFGASAEIIDCTLFWDAPTEYADSENTPLEESFIEYYNVYVSVNEPVDLSDFYGRTPDNQTEPFQAPQTSMQIQLDLPPGVHDLHFAVVAVLRNGTPSDLSASLIGTHEVVIPPKPPTNLRTDL